MRLRQMQEQELNDVVINIEIVHSEGTAVDVPVDTVEIDGNFIYLSAPARNLPTITLTKQDALELIAVLKKAVKL
jgi:hypothetical protein